MFVTRKVLVGALLMLLCFGALIYKTQFSNSMLNNIQGGEDIVIEISSDSDVSKKGVTGETTPTPPPDAESDAEPADNVQVVERPPIDLAISSPQPSSTVQPRGHHAAPDLTKKIGDSWDHVKDTQEILKFVRSQCEKYDRITAEPGEVRKPRMLIVAKNWKEHKLLYSSNPKTGSTSFKKWFTRIQGDSRPYSEMSGVHSLGKYGNLNQAWELAESKSSDPSSVTLGEVIKPFYSVGFMRNPLSRLISGFRDKILRRTDDGIKPEMLRINPSLTGESSDPEKFAAFAEGVMRGKINNFHFTPQWGKMKICDFPYDMIAQTETTSQQIKEVQEHTNTTQFEFPGSRAEIGADSVATVHLAHEFYDKVKPDVMALIYQYYRWDFVLMGYTKLSNPNFPYLDFNQDFDKEFDLLGEEDAMSTKTEPPG